MGNSQDRERTFQGSSSVSITDATDSLSELRRLLLAPEQDQLDRLAERLDTKVPRSDFVTIEEMLNAKHEQLLLLEQRLNHEKGKLAGVEGNVKAQEEELRNLERRLAIEAEQLAALEHKFTNKMTTALEVSEVLPQAVDLRQKQDAKLSFSLAPLIADSFEALLKKSPKKIIAILGPELGRLITEYARTVIRKFTDEINEIVNHSLTTEALKWRVEAYMKGVPYAELFFSRTLRFRVEQVFLIQKDSGILLCEVAREKGAVLDHDAISAMLTAIVSFVNDSFVKDEHEEKLNYITVGNYKIVVEHGHDAILAGVVKGASPPPNLSMRFKATLDDVHQKFEGEFQAFDGDTRIFDAASIDLKECLVQEWNKDFTPPKKKKPWVWLLAGGCVVLLLVWFLWLRETESQRLNRMLDQVKSQQGVISASITHGDGNEKVLRVLRDSTMPDVVQNVAMIVEKAGIDIPIKQYLAMASMDIQKMAGLLLTPPASVTLTVDNDVVVASGSATHDWVERFERSPALLPGIKRVDGSQLVDADLKAFEDLKNTIESHEVRFEQGRARLSSDLQNDLKNFSINIKSLDNVLQRLGKHGKIEVYGHTSPEGSERRNQRIASARANNVISALNVQDLQALQVVPVALASKSNLTSALSDEDLSKRRRISLRVVVEE